MKKRRSKKVVHRPTAKKRGRSRLMLMDSPALRPSGWRKSAQSDLQLTLKVPQVKVGPRHRKEMGNITALAKDINERGLLHPIVVDHKNNLIAGERRLKAWQISNFRDQPIPVRVVPLDDIVAGEWAENDPALRKNFTPSEAVAIARELRPRLEAAAKERQRAGGRGKASGKFPEAGKGEARDAIAKATGKSDRSLRKAEAIVVAAEKEPAKFGKLKKRMDETGRVDGPFKQLQTMKAAEQIRKEPPPSGQRSLSRRGH